MRSADDTLKTVHLVVRAVVDLASILLPVPGGPHNNMPFRLIALNCGALVDKKTAFLMLSLAFIEPEILSIGVVVLGSTRRRSNSTLFAAGMTSPGRLGFADF